MTEPAGPNRSTPSREPWSSQLLGGFLHLLHAYLVVVQVILLLGFVLLLLGADPASEFVRWEYRSLERAMAPFRGAFQPLSIGGADSQVQPVLDTAVLFAMVIYGLGIAAVDSATGWFRERVRRSSIQAQLQYQQRVADHSRTALTSAIESDASGATGPAHRDTSGRHR